MKCLACNTDISDKAKYCSDKCRKVYTRSLQRGAKPNPDKTTRTDSTRTLDFKLSRTDQTFEDHDPGYYKFTMEREDTCLICDKPFKTRLQLLKYCSRDHMEQALKILNGEKYE